MTIYSAYSTKKSAKTKLNTPVISTLTQASSTSVNITWNQIAGAAGYVIYRYDGVSKKWTAVKTITSGTTLTYTNTGLVTGRAYQYKIRAYRNTTKIYSAYSTIKTITPQAQVLTTPTVTLQLLTTTSVKLSWNAVSGATGYEIQRKDNVNPSWTTVTTSQLTYTGTGLTLGRTYTYRVRAYGSGSNYGPYSAEKSITLVQALGPDGRVPVPGFLDGSQINTKTNSQIISEFGTPTKTYNTSNGQVLMYSTGANLKYVRTNGNVVVEVFSMDSSNVDMYGVKVGDSFTTACNKVKRFLNYDCSVSTGLKAITVLKPYYDNAIESYYYLYDNKVESFQHIAYMDDTSPVGDIEKFPPTLINEGVAEKMTIDFTNAYRNKLGLSSLEEHSAVNTAAKNHAIYLYVNNLLTHEGQGGSNSGDRVAAAGYNTIISIENIASSLSTNPAAIFYTYIVSADHRNNLIKTNVAKTGVGVVYKQARPGQSTTTSEMFHVQVFTN